MKLLKDRIADFLRANGYTYDDGEMYRQRGRHVYEEQVMDDVFDNVEMTASEKRNLSDIYTALRQAAMRVMQW